MLGRIWKRGKKETKVLEEEEIITTLEEEQVAKAKKTKVGKFQIIETKLKYKYDIKSLFEIMMDLTPPVVNLHISPGFPPYFRYNGELLVTDLPPLTVEESAKLLYQYCPSDKIHEFEKNYCVEFCNEVPGLSKFRANLRKENRGIGGVFKRLPSKSFSIDQLNLPKIYKDIAKNEQGLIVISGPPNSGKTTTVGALVKFISNARTCKILVLEKVIEAIHPTKKGIVIHKEIGKDVPSCKHGIEQAFLEDVDVIVTGEIEDRESIELLLKAARAGMLVITEFYPKGTVKTLERIISLFPESEHNNICQQLSKSLLAVTSQCIVHKKSSQGKTLVSEILLANTEVRISIKEGNFSQIPMIIERSRSEGMQSLDDELENLLKENKISYDMVKNYCISPERFISQEEK